MNKNIEKYGFCPVTEPEKRKQHMKLLERKIELLSQLKNELSSKELSEYKMALLNLEQLRRIDRSETDVLFFMYQYFSEDMNPNNSENLIPQGVAMEDAPDFHIELTGMLNVVSNEEINKRVAWASPRGSAKSAYLSNVFPLHQAVFQKRKYILIISETESISQRFMEWLGNSLKFNDLLREDFGELLSPSKQSNEIDNLSMFKTKTGTLVEASSMGSQLRGKRNGSYRPDLVIMDDMESSKNTNTAELREKNLHWFDSVVLPIGDPHKTSFIYIGTAVHAEGLLFSVMSRPEFNSKLFSAIISEPERQDLWDELEQMLRDSSNNNRLIDAREFYETNKEEMDKGVEVLWSQKWSYFDLMLLKSSMTTRAFNSEYRNNPRQLEDLLFNPTQFSYTNDIELKEIQHRLIYYGAWDIAYTANKRSDYNSVTILAKDRLDGQLYVIENWNEKIEPHKALEKVYELICKYQPTIFSVETTGGATDLFRQLQKIVLANNNCRTRLKPLKTNRSYGSKNQRIESLEPLIKNGSIKFQRKHTMLLEQFEMFPFGKHDDAIDSLEMSVQLVGINQTRKSWSKKPQGL